jgi:hypothetical protein
MTPKMQIPKGMRAKMIWKIRRTRKFLGITTIWGACLGAIVASKSVLCNLPVNQVLVINMSYVKERRYPDTLALSGEREQRNGNGLYLVESPLSGALHAGYSALWLAYWTCRPCLVAKH